MTQHRKIKLSHFIKAVFLVLPGMGSVGMGLKGFLMFGNFIDGGAPGISMLPGEIFELPPALLVPLTTLPFIIMANRYVGRAFASRSASAIAASADG